jgi:rubrerythrin
MIRVHLTFIVFLYLIVFLAIVALCWLADERRRRRAARAALQFRLRCAICGLEFEDRSTDALPSCPRCGQPNERVEIDRL